MDTGEFQGMPAPDKLVHALSSDRRLSIPKLTNKDGMEICYKDRGDGQPIVFSHGRPLSADACEDQMFFLSSRGYRCIAHDRRGHSRSSQPWNGNEMETCAEYFPCRRKQEAKSVKEEARIARAKWVRRLK